MDHVIVAKGVMALLSAAFLVFVVMRWLPWIGRALALYGLHGLRDEFYVAAREHPKARDTRLYRDVEIYFCSLIRTVREEAYPATLAIYLVLESNAPPSEEQKVRRRLYSKERDVEFAGESGQRAHDIIVSTCADTRRFIALYAYLGHPLLQAFGFLASVIYLLSFPAKWISRRRPPLVDQLAQATSTTLHDPHTRPTHTMSAIGKVLGNRLRRRPPSDAPPASMHA